MGRLKETIRALLPRHVRPRIVLGGPLRGATLVTSWHDYPGALLGTTERPLLAWFARHVRPGETWLDVGAHYGYTALAVARLTGPAGRVFAFEPVGGTAECVERTAAANHMAHLRVVRMALSDSPVPARLDLPQTRGMADRTLSTGSTLTIAHQALDSLWLSLHNGDAAIHGIKIDVQGMEGEALLGMRRVLNEQHPKLAIEFHTGVSRQPILALLGECGYSIDAEPIDPRSGELADDCSYAFYPTGNPTR
ncbi:MAG: FkbM family methyltransferase [Bryobacteraceae bacterium]